jgi:hypothetical protein
MQVHNENINAEPLFKNYKKLYFLWIEDSEAAIMQVWRKSQFFSE